jgi:hypothetical protein
MLMFIFILLLALWLLGDQFLHARRLYSHSVGCCDCSFPDQSHPGPEGSLNLFREFIYKVVGSSKENLVARPGWRSARKRWPDFLAHLLGPPGDKYGYFLLLHLVQELVDGTWSESSFPGENT